MREARKLAAILTAIPVGLFRPGAAPAVMPPDYDPGVDPAIHENTVSPI